MKRHPAGQITGLLQCWGWEGGWRGVAKALWNHEGDTKGPSQVKIRHPDVSLEGMMRTNATPATGARTSIEAAPPLPAFTLGICCKRQKACFQSLMCNKLVYDGFHAVLQEKINFDWG